MGGQKPEKTKKRICIGILAHVDAGKTTLSEGLLYLCGEIRKLGRMNGVDRCLICGEVIPEGSQVCTACRNKYDIVTGETEEMAQELRDIADVLKITEGTDTNIRKSMESILRIADRLERTSNGKKRR